MRRASMLQRGLPSKRFFSFCLLKVYWWRWFENSLAASPKPATEIKFVVEVLDTLNTFWNFYFPEIYSDAMAVEKTFFIIDKLFDNEKYGHPLRRCPFPICWWSIVKKCLPKVRFLPICFQFGWTQKSIGIQKITLRSRNCTITPAAWRWAVISAVWFFLWLKHTHV